MIEKLVENWLDNASERSYQAVFVQLLTAKGYKVVHSTRHSSLEFGKDILAIDPDGIGCAFQLKGNPGGRLSLSQFRSDLQDQLVQLMTYSIEYSGFPSGTHKSYLVSNGYFEEEVQHAVGTLNRNSAYPSKVSLISRGELLSDCLEYGANLWPSELADSRCMLEIFLADAKDLLPAEKLGNILGRALCLDSVSRRLKSKAGFQRAATSAALLTGIVTSHFAEAKNHFAVVSAWTVYSCMLIASSEKHGYKMDRGVLRSMDVAQEAISDALRALWGEVAGRSHLVEGDALSDPEVYRWRYTLLLGLFSGLLILDDTGGFLDCDERRAIEDWLVGPHKHVLVWGEGAVPSIVSWLIWLRSFDATLRPDFEIASLADRVISLNQRKHKGALASPYYGYDEIVKSQMGIEIVDNDLAWSGESFDGCSYVVEPLFHALVRTMLKQRCRFLWPEFSKLSHRVVVPNNRWEYCLATVLDGVDETRIYPPSYSWQDLKADVHRDASDRIPPALASRPGLLALWWLVAPQRFTTHALNAFIERVIPGWGA